MEIGDKSEVLTSFVVFQQNIKQMIGIHFSNGKKKKKKRKSQPQKTQNQPKTSKSELVGKALTDPIKFTSQSRSELGL